MKKKKSNEVKKKKSNEVKKKKSNEVEKKKTDEAKKKTDEAKKKSDEAKRYPSRTVSKSITITRNDEKQTLIDKNDKTARKKKVSSNKPPIKSKQSKNDKKTKSGLEKVHKKSKAKPKKRAQSKKTSEIPPLSLNSNHVSITSLRRVCRRSNVTSMEVKLLNYLRVLVEAHTDVLCQNALFYMKSSANIQDQRTGRKTISKEDVKNALRIMKTPILG